MFKSILNPIDFIARKLNERTEPEMVANTANIIGGSGNLAVSLRYAKRVSGSRELQDALRTTPWSKRIWRNPGATTVEVILAWVFSLIPLIGMFLSHRMSVVEEQDFNDTLDYYEGADDPTIEWDHFLNQPMEKTLQDWLEDQEEIAATPTGHQHDGWCAWVEDQEEEFDALMDESISNKELEEV